MNESLRSYASSSSLTLRLTKRLKPGAVSGGKNLSTERVALEVEVVLVVHFGLAFEVRGVRLRLVLSLAGCLTLPQQSRIRTQQHRKKTKRRPGESNEEFSTKFGKVSYNVFSKSSEVRSRSGIETGKCMCVPHHELGALYQRG